MSIANKRLGIQQVASQIHSGAEAEPETSKAVASIFGDDVTTTDAPATTLAYTHNDSEVLILTGLTGATTLNLTAGAYLPEGAELTVSVAQGATPQNLVLGTGITGDDLAGVANDVDVLVIKYLGADAWTLVSNTKIVDAA